MAEIEPIRISFQYTQDDFLHAWRYYHASRGAGKLNNLLAGLLSLIGLWLAFFRGTELYALTIFVIAIAIWFNVLGELRLRLFYRANAEAIAQHYVAVIDDSGIYIKSSTYEAKRSWDGYIGLLESNQTFLLLQGKELFSIYPKRAFRDEKQQESFRSLAIGKMNANSSSSSN